MEENICLIYQYIEFLTHPIIFSQSTESSSLLKSSLMSALIFYLLENALKKLLLYSGMDHTTMHCTGLYPISVFNFILMEICVASCSSSIISSTSIACLAGSQTASTCFKEVAPSTAYSNRNEYNSSLLIGSSAAHNGDIFIIIFCLFTLKKILRDSGVTASITNRIYMGSIPEPRSSPNSSPPNTFLLYCLAHVGISHSRPLPTESALF